MNALKILTALLAGLLLLAPIAAANELVIKNVELEDDEVAPGAMLEITFDLENPSDKDYKDVVVTAQVKGDDDTKVTKDFGTIFAGSKREERKITVNVPEDLRDGSYKAVLKAKGVLKGVGTRTSTLEVPFTVEQKDFSVFVDKVELSDENLLAGTSFDVAVKVSNNGKEDLESVKVQVEIPELKAKQSVVLRELAQDNEQTVYLSLGVPQAAESGLYTLKVTASNAKTLTAVATQNVEITKVAAPAVIVDNQKVVPTQVITPSIKLGQGAVVSLEVRNNQDAARTFDVVLGGVADWTSNARIDPASVTLDAGESATVHAYLMPKASGDKSFTLYLKDGATLVSATQVNVKVAGSAMPVASGQSVDKSWAVVIGVVILGIIGAVWSRNKNEGQKKLGAVYY